MKKILLTVHQFLPEYFSGTEVLAFSVAKEFVRRGHQVFIFTGFPDQSLLPDELRFDEYLIDGIQVFRFHHSFVPMGGQCVIHELEYNNQLVAGYLSFLIQRISPDIVHFFHLSRLGASLIDVTYHLRIPSFYTPTDFWSICPTSQLLLDDGNICHGPSTFSGNCVKHVIMPIGGLKVARIVKLMPSIFLDLGVCAAKAGLFQNRKLSREVAAIGERLNFIVSRLNTLHTIFSPNQLMTEVLTKNGVNKRLISQSSFGIDLTFYGEQKREKQNNQPLTFGFIGTLSKHKGCHILIEAFLRVNQNAAILKIYGNQNEYPDYYTELLNKAANFNCIEFCGTFPNNQIAQVLAQIDVLVVPSLWHENNPLVIYSAMASKCPVVASNFRGITEVIRNGSNGLTFEPGDVNGLKTALTRFIEEPGLLARLSMACELPRSITAYADELLETYSFTRTVIPNVRLLPNLLHVKPFQPAQKDSSYICGWATIAFETPSKVLAYVGEKLIAQSDRFTYRPEIRNILRTYSPKCSTINCGFTLTLPAHTDRNMLSLLIQSKTGDTVQLELKDLSCGYWVNLTNGTFVGLDSEKFDQ